MLIKDGRRPKFQASCRPPTMTRACPSSPAPKRAGRTQRLSVLRGWGGGGSTARGYIELLFRSAPQHDFRVLTPNPRITCQNLPAGQPPVRASPRWLVPQDSLAQVSSRSGPLRILPRESKRTRAQRGCLNGNRNWPLSVPKGPAQIQPARY